MVQDITVIANLINNVSKGTRTIQTDISKLDNGFQRITKNTQSFNKESKLLSDKTETITKTINKNLPALEKQLNLMENSEKITEQTSSGSSQLKEEYNDLFPSMKNLQSSAEGTTKTLEEQRMSLLKNYKNMLFLRDAGFDVSDMQKNLGGEAKRLGTTVGKLNSLFARFKMHLLGVMFFGMMLQRVFLGIMKQGVDTFMKITQGQTEAGQAVTALSANFQFLQFAVGDAIASVLLPLLPVIVGIIEAIVNFISQNQQLVGILLIVGGVIGTFLFAFGALNLGLKATSQAFGFLSTVFSAGGIKILLIVGAIAAIAYLLYRAWETNFLNIRGIAGMLIKAIATILEVGAPVFKTLGAGAIFLFYLIKFAFENIEDIIMVVWDAIAIYTLSVWNIIVSIISTEVNFVIDIINGLVYAANLILAAFGQPLVKGIEHVAAGFGLLADTGGLANDMMVRAERLGRKFGDTMTETATAIEGFNTQYDATVVSLKGMGDELIKQGEEISKKQAAGEAKTFGEVVSTDVGNIANMVGGMIGGLGETLSGGNTVQNNVTVNTGPISSDIDITELANTVADRISEDTKLYMNPTTTKF